MAIIQVTERHYNCLQEDIDLFNNIDAYPGGCVFCCTDSGAIYKTEYIESKEDGRVQFVLKDIINRKSRKANPICMCQDLLKFKGKHFRIIEAIENIILRENLYKVEKDGYVRVGQHITNSSNNPVIEYITASKRDLLRHSVFLCLAVRGGKILHEGDVKLCRFTDGLEEEIFSNTEINATDLEPYDNISRLNYLDMMYDLGETDSNIYLKIASGVDCYISIVEPRWLRLTRGVDAQRGIDTVDGAQLVRVGKDNILLYNRSIYNTKELGKFGYFDNNKFSSNVNNESAIFSYSNIQRFKVPDDVDYITSITLNDNLSGIYSDNIFVAEILD